MSEKTETGKEVKGSPKPKKKLKPDPFDRKKKDLLGRIKTRKESILTLHEEIGLIDSLQYIVTSFSGAKVVRPEEDLRYYSPLNVSLPDIETLGAFFRELKHLKSKMPKVELTYSGQVTEDKVLAEVKIRFKEE